MKFNHRIGLGAGPVSGLMTGDNQSGQMEVVKAVLASGGEWIDTAAGYGSGKSESSLGEALQALHFPDVQIATKFRLSQEQSSNPHSFIRESVLASLKRLRLSSCELLYLHNAITKETGDEQASIAEKVVLQPDGVLDAMERLKAEGLVRNLGLTATGDPECNLRVLATGRIDAIQIPFHLLNPSAGMAVPVQAVEKDYKQQIPRAKALGVRVFAIRVLAGGALALRQPSAHTLTTPYFPLALFQNDSARARKLLSFLPSGITIQEAAIRFVLGHPDVDCLLMGLATVQEAGELFRIARLGPLNASLEDKLLSRSL